MKLFITNQLPQSGSGTYAHYNNKDIYKKGWQYLDIRKYTTSKYHDWIYSVEDWHSDMSVTALKCTKWWWLLAGSRVSSWDYNMKPLFFSLAIIDLIENNKYKELYIIHCPYEVISYIKEFRPNIKINQSIKSSLILYLNKTTIVLYKSHLAQQIKLLIKIIKIYFKVKRYSLGLRKTSDVKLVIFSLFTNLEVNKTKMDHYFGNILHSASKEDSTLWLYESSIKKNDELSIEAFLKAKNVSYIIFYSLVNIFDILKIWFICIKIIFNLFKVKNKLPNIYISNLQGSHFSKMIFYKRIIHPPIYELCLYYSVLRLINIYPEINTLIYPYEEKGFERSILFACMHSARKIKTIGYAHALHSTGSIYLKYRNKNSVYPPKPDIIASTGVRSAMWLTEWAKIPPEKIVTIGSSRYITHIPVKSTKKERLNCLKILIIIGPGHELSTLQKYVESDKHIFDKCEIWIRKYPYGWIAEQNNTISKITRISKNINTEKAPIMSQFEWSDVVIFNSSSAGIEAMLSGRYTINLELHDLIKIDPLEFKGNSSSVVRCANVGELKNVLRDVRNMNQNEFLESIKNQIDYAKQIYGPVNQNILKKLING